MMLSGEDEIDSPSSKLGIFQAFSKLYEHDRELLDSMMALDANAPLKVATYIQGMVCDQQVYIISNLATGKSKRFNSVDGLWTLGRDPRQSDIAMPDKRLSRCHAALQYSAEQECFILSDLESTNGTYVNGDKLKRVYALRDGDRIRIGSSLFNFFTCTTESGSVDIPEHASEGTEDKRTLH
ncbi:FHA domain-containing protein [Leptothoe kymatousa]|nr:FHA domain-containing protein [Leptothoe kymatousa]